MGLHHLKLTFSSNIASILTEVVNVWTTSAQNADNLVETEELCTSVTGEAIQSLICVMKTISFLFYSFSKGHLQTMPDNC